LDAHILSIDACHTASAPTRLCRVTSRTEREKDSYFEELIRTYLRYGARYTVVCANVLLFTFAHGIPL